MCVCVCVRERERERELEIREEGQKGGREGRKNESKKEIGNKLAL